MKQEFVSIRHLPARRLAGMMPTGLGDDRADAMGRLHGAEP
jgi:hypothetical protein